MSQTITIEHLEYAIDGEKQIHEIEVANETIESMLQHEKLVATECEDIAIYNVQTDVQGHVVSFTAGFVPETPFANYTATRFTRTA